MVDLFLLTDLEGVGRKGQVVQVPEEQYFEQIAPYRVAVAGSPEVLESLEPSQSGVDEVTNRPTGRKPSNIPPTEYELVANLRKVWGITTVRTRSFRRSSYVYAYARPTKGLRDKFHLDRDLLVIFETSKEHTVRSLQLAEEILHANADSLDRLAVILVSNDDQIENKIDEFVKKHPESRIIVPMPYKFLISASAQDQEKLLQDRLFRRDLYSFNSPLQHDAQFFGRGALVADCYDKYKSGQNTGLFGLRKTGKTSILYAIHRQLARREEPFVHIDCEEPSVYRLRWNDLLWHVVRRSAQQLKVPIDDLRTRDSYGESEASLAFEEDLRTIQQQLGGSKRILFTFDEIEYITFGIAQAEHWAHGDDFLEFWQSIRAVFQRNPSLFSIIIAGVNPFCVECDSVGGYENPVYLFISPHYVQMFSLAEMTEMVVEIGKKMGLQYEESVLSFLFEEFGGHPFLVRHVCSTIHQSLINTTRPLEVNAVHVKSMRQRISGDIAHHISHILSVLRKRYPEEYDMLCYLATGQDAKFRHLAEASPLFINHLVHYGIVREETVSGGPGFEFRLRAMGEYLRRHVDADSKDVIPGLRGKALRLLRKVIKLVLKANYGELEARTELLSRIQEGPRKLRLMRQSLDILLGDTSPLSLEDFHKMVMSHWSDFAKVFRDDQVRFDQSLREVLAYSLADSDSVNELVVTSTLTALNWLIRVMEDHLR